MPLAKERISDGSALLTRGNGSKKDADNLLAHPARIAINGWLQILPTNASLAALTGTTKQRLADNKAMDTKPREEIEFTNYADGVAIISAPFYLRAISSRLGHRKRYRAWMKVSS